MKLTELTELIKRQTREYFDQELETFFIEPEGGKSLSELIREDCNENIWVTRTGSSSFGSVIELQIIRYSGRRKNKPTINTTISKITALVNMDVRDSELLDISVRYEL